MLFHQIDFLRMKVTIMLNQPISQLELHPELNYFYQAVMFLSEDKDGYFPRFSLPKFF